MRANALWLAVLVALAAAPAEIATAQEENRFLKMSVAELAQTWLLRNCGTEEEALLEVAIVRQAVELNPIFVDAWRQGPDQESVDETRKQARERFDRGRVALQDPEGLGLSAEDARRAQERTAEAFVGRAVSTFETGCRSQALRGLYLVGGEQGRRILEDVANDAQSEYAVTARLILSGAGPQIRN